VKRPGLRASINAFCRSCIYDPIGGTGTWRQQVEACTSPGCPLYAVRPVSTTAEDDPEKADFSAEDGPNPVEAA
jgi:hypothetical protein